MTQPRFATSSVGASAPTEPSRSSSVGAARSEPSASFSAGGRSCGGPLPRADGPEASERDVRQGAGGGEEEQSGAQRQEGHRLRDRSGGRPRRPVHRVRAIVSEVVRHKLRGYRGAICGWDRVCRHPQYVEDADADFVQPFYSVVPDENDAIRSFGGPRMLQYVAQEHLESLREPFRISNRNVLMHFESYSPRLGRWGDPASGARCALCSRYVPKPPLRYEYPDEYVDEDAQPCEGEEGAFGEESRKAAAPTRPRRRKAPQKKSRRHAQRRPTRSTSKERGPAVKQPKVEGKDKAV